MQMKETISYHFRYFVSGSFNSSAEQIDLSFNLIQTIVANSFTTTSSCQVLRLSYNPIKSVETDAFKVSYPEKGTQIICNLYITDPEIVSRD